MPTPRSRRSLRARPGKGPWSVGVLVGVAAAIACAPAHAEPSDHPLLLDVKINGTPTGKIGDFLQRGGKLYATRKELRELGLNLSGKGDDASEVSISDLPKVRFTLDEAAQTVELSVPVSALALTRLEPEGEAASAPLSRTGSGLVLNYEASALAGKETTGVIATGEARAFGEWGVASTGFTAARLPNLDTFIRLDSTYTYSDPDSLRRFRIGDVITGGLPWSRPVRLGGAQAAIDFSMQPNLVTFPTPTVSGQAAVPSTVDVLVNGVQTLSRGVPAGPFNVPRLPLVGGAGAITIDLRDPTGNLTTQVLNFYISPTLMKSGLSSFSLEAGAVRRNFGLFSNDYRDLAGSATWRYGVSDALTASAHAEASQGLDLVEAGFTGTVGDFGVLTLASGFSENRGQRGGLFYGAFERETRRYSFAASAQVTTPNFQDIAGLNGSPPPRRVLQASAGVSLGKFGSLGAVFARVDGPLTPCSCSPLQGGLLTAAPVPGTTPDHAALASATYSTRIFGRMSLSASGYRDLESHGGGGLVSLTIPLGGRTTATPAVQHENGRLQPTFQMIRPTGRPGQWGGQIYDAEGGALTRRFGEVEYRSGWGVVSGGLDSEGPAGVTTARAMLRGAITVLDGGTFLSPPIQDSFAVVDANGRAGVPVYVENQPAGRTNSAGKLLVPDLKSYDTTKVAIDPTDLALDSEAPHPDLYLRPSDRAGVVANFNIKTVDQALVTLVDAHGQPLPVGSVAAMANNPASFPVGYDGQLYLTGLERHDRLQVTLPNGQQCAVEFDYKRVKGDIPKIGPLVCRNGPLSAQIGLRGRI